MQFVADLEPNDDGVAADHVRHRRAARTSPSSTCDHLTGYEGARPVRIGNGAFDQRQNDVFGAVLDSLLLHTRRSQHLPRRLWPLIQAQAECAIAVWGEPDQGIWEARGKPQHYVSSKLMGWVALDRAAKLAAIRGDDRADGRRGRHARTQIRADILAHGVSDARRAAPALRHRRAGRLDPARRACSASCRAATSGCAPPWTPSRATSPRTASSCGT